MIYTGKNQEVKKSFLSNQLSMEREWQMISMRYNECCQDDGRVCPAMWERDAAAFVFGIVVCRGMLGQGREAPPAAKCKILKRGRVKECDKNTPAESFNVVRLKITPPR